MIYWLLTRSQYDSTFKEQERRREVSYPYMLHSNRVERPLRCYFVAHAISLGGRTGRLATPST